MSLRPLRQRNPYEENADDQFVAIRRIVATAVTPRDEFRVKRNVILSAPAISCAWGCGKLQLVATFSIILS
jgi:hypothetical protein